MQELFRRLDPRQYFPRGRSTEPVPLLIYPSEEDQTEFSSQVERKAQEFLEVNESSDFSLKIEPNQLSIFSVVMARNGSRRFMAMSGTHRFDSDHETTLSVVELESDGQTGKAVYKRGWFSRGDHIRMLRTDVVDFSEAFLGSEIDREETDKLIAEELGERALRLL